MKLVVQLAQGGDVTYGPADGYTGYEVHPSGALLVFDGGVDVGRARWVLSFGTWAAVEEVGQNGHGSA